MVDFCLTLFTENWPCAFLANVFLFLFNQVLRHSGWVRRSERQPNKSALEKLEREIQIRKAVESGTESGLEEAEFGCKGRGIVSTRSFEQGSYVCEYSGELVTSAVANEREIALDLENVLVSYMYYFKHCEEYLCIDATFESGKLGRLINHSKEFSNLTPVTIVVDGKPHIVFVAKRDILPGEELLYDYGDRRRDAVIANDWLLH